jgi:hypothetical protein
VNGVGVVRAAWRREESMVQPCGIWKLHQDPRG